MLVHVLRHDPGGRPLFEDRVDRPSGVVRSEKTLHILLEGSQDALLLVGFDLIHCPIGIPPTPIQGDLVGVHQGEGGLWKQCKREIKCTSRGR